MEYPFNETSFFEKVLPDKVLKFVKANFNGKSYEINLKCEYNYLQQILDFTDDIVFDFPLNIYNEIINVYLPNIKLKKRLTYAKQYLNDVLDTYFRYYDLEQEINKLSKTLPQEAVKLIFSKFNKSNLKGFDYLERLLNTLEIINLNIKLKDKIM